jgi:hypothetical protein
VKPPQLDPAPMPQIVYSRDAAAPRGEPSGPPERPDPNAPTVVWRGPQALGAEPAAEPASVGEAPLLSPEADEAAALSFGALSASLEVRSAELADELVREMLRPMLKAMAGREPPGHGRASGAGGDSAGRARVEVAGPHIQRRLTPQRLTSHGVRLLDSLRAGASRTGGLPFASPFPAISTACGASPRQRRRDLARASRRRAPRGSLSHGKEIRAKPLKSLTSRTNEAPRASFFNRRARVSAPERACSQQKAAGFRPQTSAMSGGLPSVLVRLSAI